MKTMPTVKVGVVGCGYWGQNLLRNFWEQEQAELVLACDQNAKALARAQRRFPTLQLSKNFQELLSNPQIDAVVLATPVSTHYRFAKEALLAGKHVLVEKPLCTKSEEAIELIELARKYSRTLMVDHTFLYTSAVRRMKALLDSGELGDLLYYDSVRINLGLLQSDINVLWDLGPHDFSIMDYLCELDPVSISAIGVNHLNWPFENIAYVTARFNSHCNLIAHFHLNWLAPVKVRRTLVGGSKKMLVYDDLEASEKIKVYDKGITFSVEPEDRNRLLTGYRNGDMLAPNLDTTEALHLMAHDFVSSILQDRAPLTDGCAGYRVVRLLEAAQQSLEQNGRQIELGRPAFPRTPVVSAVAGVA